MFRIIQARMEEIIEHVYYEIKNSGYEKKLIGGIVVTGGGSQLKHITQLFEYITGMDSRIGFPNEHLGKGAELVTSPMYATGVGLVIKGFEKYARQQAVKPTSIKNHTEKTKGRFFEAIFSRSKKFFDDDEVN
jgi:cell division protein FtsA